MHGNRLKVLSCACAGVFDVASRSVDYLVLRTFHDFRSDTVMKNTHIFDLYTDYLLTSFSNTTAAGLSKMLDRQISHDQASRFF